MIALPGNGNLQGHMNLARLVADSFPVQAASSCTEDNTKFEKSEGVTFHYDLLSISNMCTLR